MSCELLNNVLLFGAGPECTLQQHHPAAAVIEIELNSSVTHSQLSYLNISNTSLCAAQLGAQLPKGKEVLVYSCESESNDTARLLGVAVVKEDYTVGDDGVH